MLRRKDGVIQETAANLLREVSLSFTAPPRAADATV